MNLYTAIKPERKTKNRFFLYLCTKNIENQISLIFLITRNLIMLKDLNNSKVSAHLNSLICAKIPYFFDKLYMPWNKWHTRFYIKYLPV